MLSTILGFGLCTAWMWLFLLSGPLLLPILQDYALSGDTVTSIYLISHALTALGIAKYVPTTTTHHINNKPLSISILAMSLLPMLLLWVPTLFTSGITASPLYPLLGACIGGIAAALPFIAWLAYFSALDFLPAIFSIGGGFLVAGLFTIASGHLSMETNLIIISFLPLLTWYFYQNKLIHPTSTHHTKPLSSISIKEFYTSRSIIYIALIYIFGGSTFKLLALQQEFSSAFYIANLSYGLICLGAGYYFTRSSLHNIDILYQAALPLIGSGFILLILPWLNAYHLGFIVLQCGLGCFDLYTTLLIITFAKLHPRPLAVCGTGIFMVTIFISMGNLLYTLLTQFFPRLLDPIALSCSMGILSLWIIVTFPKSPGIKAFRDAFTSEYQQRLDYNIAQEAQETTNTITPFTTSLWLPPPTPITTMAAPVTDDAEPTVVSVKDTLTYKQDQEEILLTPREEQVFHLLIRGYKYSSISEELGVSLNTTKFHIKHLYEKFHVTSKQALIQWAENYYKKTDLE